MKKNPSNQKQFLFQPGNYRMLLIAICLIALGFILMVGGGSDDPTDLFSIKQYSASRDVDLNKRTKRCFKKRQTI